MPDDASEAIDILLGLRIQNPDLFSDSLVAAYGNRAAALRKLDGRGDEADADISKRQRVLQQIRDA